VPSTIVDEHVWMFCGGLQKFVHISWVMKWIYKISKFLVSGIAGLAKSIGLGKLAKETRI